MKIVIFIILYIVGVMLTGGYLYKRQKSKTFSGTVDETSQLIIVLLSLFFPIIYLLGLLMILISVVGDKLCKDKKKN